MRASLLNADTSCPFITEITQLNEGLIPHFSTPQSLITILVESNQKMDNAIREYEQAQNRFRRALICSIIAPDFVSDRDNKVLSDCDKTRAEKEKNFRETKMKVISYTSFYLRLGGTMKSLAAALFPDQSEQQIFLKMNEDFELFVRDHFSRLNPSHPNMSSP